MYVLFVQKTADRAGETIVDSDGEKGKRDLGVTKKCRQIHVQIKNLKNISKNKQIELFFL